MREVTWVPLSAALAKMSADRPFIDDWQREELGRCGLHQRELPLVTEKILRKLQVPRYLVITPYGLQALGSVSAANPTPSP